MLTSNNRLLIVDDNEAIHEDFRKILAAAPAEPRLLAAEAVLFDREAEPGLHFELTGARQGEQALALARAAMAEQRPFALAFVDIRMPPGIDGIETTRRLWEIDPDLPVVICSAYSDYAWTDMSAQLGAPERWVLLKKPFENVEVLQLAAALVQKRELQQAARARATELEARVAERTEKLRAALQRLEEEARERLRAEAARHELERKMEQAQRLESLGVLAGGIAHDFNNLLTGILGRASLARLLGTQSAEVDDHLREIELCARRAAELCEQMLAYAGQSRVTIREVDLNELVQDMRGLLQTSVPRGAEFTVELAPGLPPVRGDAARLRQVVMNLVINGAEALRDPPCRLVLRTRLCALESAELAGLTFAGEAGPGRFVALEIADTGVGMTPETRQRIFEPFFTTKFEGRGLGLCAVLGIVRSHGGALEVRSTPGQGTTFRIFLPAAELPETRPAPAVAAATPATAPQTRALVVDDEEAVRAVTSFALARAGMRVETAADGLEGLERFRQSPAEFDLAILDLTMPRMNGAAALAAMREVRPGLPAVLISGFGQQQALEQIADRERTIALQKPFEIETLLQTVNQVLAAARAARAAGA